MLKNKEVLVRVNTRLRSDQDLFVKQKAEETKKSEGQIYRDIVDYYIKNNRAK